MKNTVVLCPNPARDINLACTLQAKALLEAGGYNVLVAPIYEENDILPVEVISLDAIPNDASLMVTFGGDGTILRLAPLFKSVSVPLVGVNLGHKGFLAELDADQLDLLVKAAAGEYPILERSMLDVDLIRDGELICRDIALNDAVISGVVQNIRLTALASGERIISYSGDGLIVSTPTGSTAYSMAAGGPIVEPEAQNLILTPICAHNLAVRSIILEPNRRVTVRVSDMIDKKAVLSIDGRNILDLQEGDEIIVTRSERVLPTVRFGIHGYYETIFTKLGEKI